jgi:CBS domain-containing protein
MGRAKLHVVPNTEVVVEADSPSSKTGRKPATKAKPAVCRISELMQREVAHCRPYETLNTAGRLMWDQDVGAVVVVDEQLRPLSIVTDRDLAMAAYTQGATLSHISIRSCMSQRLISCLADATPSDALQLMRENRVRRLPVVDLTGKLVGVVGLADLTRASVDKKLKTGIKVGELAATHAAILG